MSHDGPFGPVVNGTQIVFFEYLPNKPAAISFVALFGIVTLAHLVFLFIYRAWFFIPFILGGICKSAFNLDFLLPDTNILLQAKYLATLVAPRPTTIRTKQAPSFYKMSFSLPEHPFWLQLST
jgi:hypothetical protein